MDCPNCRTEMRETKAGEITIDRCLHCKAIWFDIEEIERYVKATAPNATFIPGDEDFKRHTKGLEEGCTCCGNSTLERGVVGRSEFMRCTWCGGIFLFEADLDRFELDGTYPADDESDEVVTLFGFLRDLLLLGFSQALRLP